jgi:hypothetical protein
MGLLFYDNGRIRDSADLEMAEVIMKLKEKKDYWAVIDELIKIWAAKSPDEEVATKVEIDGYKEAMSDPTFGQTNNGKDMERRSILVFPRKLQLMIRSIFKAEELPFDREFYRKFAQKYPAFKIADKV